MSALLFLYREILAQELAWMDGIRRAKKAARLPTALARDDLAAANDQRQKHGSTLRGPVRCARTFDASLSSLERRTKSFESFTSPIDPRTRGIDPSAPNLDQRTK